MSDRNPSPALTRWMPAMVMLTLALLVVASLLNGIGRVGVMAQAPGAGRHIEALVLPDSEQIPFASVDRAISRLDLDDSERAQPFEAYEQVLLALAEALPPQPDEAAFRRARTLLSGSLPAPAASDLATLLPGFLRYQRAEDGLLELTPAGPSGIEAAYLHLQLQNALRRTTLGEQVTERLYRSSHRMTEAHLVRQLLMDREDLDESEKQRRIREHMEALAGQQTEGDAG